MPDKFVHLHLHTEYSPMDAPVALKKLVAHAKGLGYKSLAVTDHGTVGAWVKFAQLCKESEIRPIFGIEAYFVPDRRVRDGQNNNYHLVLLAKTGEGIKNIYRMSERANSEGFYYNPRIDWELLEQHREGVICTSGCVNNILGEAIRAGDYDKAKAAAAHFKNIFGEDFYIELQYHCLDIEQKTYGGLARLASELGIKVVGTNDVHYLRKEDAGTQEAMMALNTKHCIRDPQRLRHGQAHFYLKSPDEMAELFDGEAARSTLEIAEKCNAEIKFGRTQLPKIDVPQQYATSMDYLESLSRKGLARIGKTGNQVYEDRFKEEMDVIRELKQRGLNFDRYFLCVYDYVQWARDNGIRVGVGRGSGVGSLVLYCLGITALDPIKYDLMFERFLEVTRNEMPDIDIDFDAEYQGKMFEYLQEKYGKDHFARITTQGVFHVASALRAAFRVFDPCQMFEKERDIKAAAEQHKKVQKQKNTMQREKKKLKDETRALADEITKMLPKDPNGRPDSKCTLLKSSYDKNDELRYVYKEVPEFEDLKKKYEDIFKFAEAIEGIVTQRSLHAAGALITEDLMVDFCPQQFVGTGDKKALATVFDMADVEKLGLIKFDILSTKVLSVLTRALRTIKERHGIDVDIDNLEPNDPKVLKLFAEANTLAIFQFESKGMQDVLKDIKADCFEDLVAVNALFRPGPKDYIPNYVKRKHGYEKVSFPTLSLAQVLKSTFGIMVYQEQVMKITRVLAGFSGSESDRVRKAMGKKKRDILDAMKPKFIKGCEEMKSCDKAVAEKIWSDMEAFAEYAFNRSHACAYAYIAYQCAYLKTYFPVEYMAAQLTVEGNDAAYDTILEYESGAKKMGIRILPADINKSKGDYTVDPVGGKPGIRKGFKGVPGLGAHTYDAIVKGQPYDSMYDYCLRAGEGAKSNIVEVLVSNGAFGWLLPKLAKKLGREADRKDLMFEYNDQAKRAQAERNQKGPRKEEKEGIRGFFDDPGFGGLEA